MEISTEGDAKPPKKPSACSLQSAQTKRNVLLEGTGAAARSAAATRLSDAV
ncbi:hypothetical protein NQZ68_027329 [Dissostichus eleginoides]|nr:hypothetical protein NQZ68_027329 [Dissostichus eleginoides]